MIVKFVIPTDEILDAGMKLQGNQNDEVGLFSISDISHLVSKSVLEVKEKLSSLVEKDAIFEFRDNYSKEVDPSDKIFEMRHHPLTVGNDYQVIGIEGNSYRIVDDNEEPVLFDPFFFEVIDNSRPDFWITEFLDDEEYSYPKEWNAEGFFEDLFDDVQEAIEIYQRVLREKYGQNQQAGW